MPNKSYWKHAADGSEVLMVLVDNGDGTFSDGVGSSSAPTAPATVLSLRPDARPGALAGGTWTLGSAIIVETVAIPDWANGFRVRASVDTKFAISEDPVASGVETLTVGNTAYANETEVRLLTAGSGRQLRLLATVAGAIVNVGFF